MTRQNELDVLKTIIYELPGFLYWKDCNSVYRGGNINFMKIAQLNSIDELIGKTDHELPWKEQADEFIIDDKKVLMQNLIIESNTNVPYVDNISISNNDIVTTLNITITTIKKRLTLPSGEFIILGFALDGSCNIYPDGTTDDTNYKFVRHSTTCDSKFMMVEEL